MRSIILILTTLISFAAEARTLGSKEQKTEFAQDAIKSVLEAYDPTGKFKLDEKSIELDKCNEYGSYVNEPLLADPYDCNIVYFYLRDKTGSVYSGKMIIDTELKKHFRFGIIPVKPKLPDLDLTVREYTDEKSKEQIYMGLSSANSKLHEQQSFEEIFGLVKSVPPSISKNVKAPLSPVKKSKGLK